MTGYDIIGDIHGYCDPLEALLDTLGYRRVDGVYRHSQHRVIFLGDFIDRGPQQREVVELARRMLDAGTALAVMGNHEFNALAWSTPDRAGGYLRPHTEKNRRQHQAFLDAYADDPQAHARVLDWFRELPIWLDLGGLRIVHACWDPDAIASLEAAGEGQGSLTESFLAAAVSPGGWQYTAIETLLKGKEIALPAESGYHDKEGTLRHNMRVRWWDRGATSYREAFMGPESARTHIPDDPIHGEHLIEYAHDAPPVFLGHYWLEGTPGPLASNIACLDYSVAKPGGKMVAYRWQGEQQLCQENFVWVSRSGR